MKEPHDGREMILHMVPGESPKLPEGLELTIGRMYVGAVIINRTGT